MGREENRLPIHRSFSIYLDNLEYLQKKAKELGISQTKFINLTIEKYKEVEEKWKDL